MQSIIDEPLENTKESSNNFNNLTHLQEQSQSIQKSDHTQSQKQEKNLQQININKQESPIKTTIKTPLKSRLLIIPNPSAHSNTNNNNNKTKALSSENMETDTNIINSQPESLPLSSTSTTTVRSKIKIKTKLKSTKLIQKSRKKTVLHLDVNKSLGKTNKTNSLKKSEDTVLIKTVKSSKAAKEKAKGKKEDKEKEDEKEKTVVVDDNKENEFKLIEDDQTIFIGPKLNEDEYKSDLTTQVSVVTEAYDSPIIVITSTVPSSTITSTRNNHFYSSSPKQCNYCGSTNTPLWRHGPPESPRLCNSCGVKWKRGKILQSQPSGFPWNSINMDKKTEEFKSLMRCITSDKVVKVLGILKTCMPIATKRRLDRGEEVDLNLKSIDSRAWSQLYRYIKCSK